MTENIYPTGAVVHAKENPGQKLVVRRFVKQVYYCTIQDKPTQKELVFYARELGSNIPLTGAV